MDSESHLAIGGTRRSLAPTLADGIDPAIAALGGCAGVVVAMMLGDWVLPFAYNQTITGFDNASFTWVMLGAIASLSMIQRHQDAEHDASSLVVSHT